MNSLFIAYFLAFFYTFVAVFYTLLVKNRQTLNQNQPLIHMGKRFSLHWLNHLTFRIFRASIWLVCVWRLFWPQLDDYLVAFASMDNIAINVTGIILMLLGFGITLLSNFTLSQSWRSGIDNINKTALVIKGVYAYSRNPAYLGVSVSQLGFFLALPCLFTLVCLIVGFIALQIQITLEESFLQQNHNQLYNDYKRSVRRWI